MSTKRILSLVLTLTLILGSFSFAFADTAIQPKANLTAEQKIAELVRLGFVKGDELGNLNLDKKITRAETSTIVAKAVVSGGEKDMVEVEKEIEKSRYQSRFTDVPADNWANPYINVSVQEGIVIGYPDNSFKPANNITYAEVITMMVNVLGQEPTPGVNWPDNYIGKARALGILEGIDVNYKGEAIRGGVFELLYNTLTNNKVGNYNIDKVLVLENNRVESIGANEIVVEVIKEVQRANFVGDSRSEKDKEARRGQQIRITVPSEVGDVEDLLGKVIDLSYDSKNIAIRSQLDNSYTYVEGPIVAKSDKKLTVGRAPNEKTYTAVLDERYNTSDERLFRTYVNDADYSYVDFENNVKTADFAKVTIKNGKVVFIDAFNFTDIAPVKEVAKNGSEVFVYNDSRDGDVKRIDVADKAKVVSVSAGKFTRSDLTKIGASDTVHVYNVNKDNKIESVLVRKDTKVEDTYKKVSEDKYGKYVTLGEKAYEIRNTDTQKAVYSFESKKFYTLIPAQADKQLTEFKDQKVTLLLDINNDVQYFGSNIELGEFVSGIEQIIGKDVRVIKGDNTRSDLVGTLDTKVKLNGNTAHQGLNALNRGDIVYNSVKQDKLDTVILLANPGVTGGAATAIGDLGKVRNDAKEMNIVNKNYIEFKTADKYAQKDFKWLDRTNVFYYDNDSNKVVATTVSKLTSETLNANLKAYVISDYEYDRLVGTDSKRATTGLKDAANTVVFTANPFKNQDSKQIVHITGLYASGDTYEVEYKDASGDKKSKLVEKDSDAYKYIQTRGLSEAKRYLIESVSELSINTTDKADINNIEILIPADDNVYEIVSSNSNAGYRLITFKDVYNNQKTLWVNVDASEFGNIGTSGTKVSFKTGDKGEIRTMIQRPVSTPLKGTLPGGTTVDTSQYTVNNVYKVANQIWVDLTDYAGVKASYKYYGFKTDVQILALKGEKVTALTSTVFGEKAVLELEKAVVGVNKDALKAAITAAKAIDTTGKTDASKTALVTAIAAGEVIVAKADTTQANVDAAKVVVDQAVAGLVNVGDLTAEATINTLAGKSGIKVILSDATKVSEVKEVKINDVVKAHTISGNEVRIIVDMLKADINTVKVVLNNGTVVTATIK